MSQYVALAVAILALVIASFPFYASHFQIEAADVGIYRIDTRTGQIKLYKLENTPHDIRDRGLPKHSLVEAARTLE